MANPYPSHLEQRLQLKDGTRVLIRPIKPTDQQIEREFVKGLSDESRYFRFMSGLRELSETMLNRFTRIDYDREMALIAVICENNQETEIGVARYVVNADNVSCEFALAVADAWQRRGVGSILMGHLIAAARQRGLRLMEGSIAAGNDKMLALMAALGFRVRAEPGNSSIRQAVKTLDAQPLPVPYQPR